MGKLARRYRVEVGTLEANTRCFFKRVGKLEYTEIVLLATNNL